VLHLYPLWIHQSVLRCPDRYCVMSWFASTSSFVCYIIVRQQNWRRPVTLVIDRIGYLSARFLGESLVYILRENSGRTEELIRYWATCGISLFIRIIIKQFDRKERGLWKDVG